MAAPVWAAKGAFQSGVGALTVPVPAGYAAGDTLLLFVNCANQTIATPAGGWTEVANSPQGTGSAGGAGGTALAVFWKIAGASESSVTVADTGSYQTSEMHLITGCPDSPIHITAGGVEAAATTSVTMPSVTTTVNDCLIILAIGLDNDGNSTAQVTSYTNASLDTITEQSDQTVNSGAGGGLGIATAGFATAGATGTTAVVTATSKTAAMLTIALRPKVEINAAGTSASTALAALTTDPLSADLVDTTTGTDTVTLASWVETGDVALIMAFRDGSATPPSVPPEGLETAVARTMPSSSAWYGVTYGNGTFVAVSSTTGTDAASSSDGITWTARTLPTSASWYAVAYGNGTFVAVANNAAAAASSSDGITWTARTLPTSNFWFSVAYGNGTFVAVSSGPSTGAASSSDGITWTARTLPSSSSWASVTYGNGTFVAVANGSTAAASSTDGITWTARTLPTSSSWRSVAYGNGVFVAVSFTTSTTAASSSDGITWTARTLPTSSAWHSVAYGDGFFVAVAFVSTAAASSTDGITWAAYTLPTSSSWRSVAYGNGTFAAVASGPSTAAATILVNFGLTTLDSSGSGTSSSVLAYKVLTAGGVQSIGPFTNATSVACNVYRTVDPTTPVGDWAISTGTGTTVTLPALTTAPDSFAVGFAGHESTDVAWPNGVEFVAVAGTLPASGNWYSVAYGGGIFSAIAYTTNGAASSADGITWTARTMPTSSGWRKIAHGNGTFAAVADGPSTTAASSSDGITWTARTMPSSNSWYTMSYCGGLFVALAYFSSAAATSSDGITWTARTLPTSSNWLGVTYGGATFVAVADSSTAAASSSDGIAWTARTMPSSSGWSSVAYGNGTFVAVATGPSTAAASSSDGITWTARTMPSSLNWRVAFGNGVFVAITTTSTVATSVDGVAWSQWTMPTNSVWLGLTYSADDVFVAVATGTTTAAARMEINPPLSVAIRAQSIDATDAIVVYDTAGPAS